MEQVLQAVSSNLATSIALMGGIGGALVAIIGVIVAGFLFGGNRHDWQTPAVVALGACLFGGMIAFVGTQAAPALLGG